MGAGRQGRVGRVDSVALQLALVGEPEPVVTTPRFDRRRRRGSRDARRTQLQLATLAQGFHPLSNAVGYRIPLHQNAAPGDDKQAPGLRCGDCRLRRLIGWHDRTYPKCMAGETELNAAAAYFELLPRFSHGGGTDVRRWWPACEDFELGDPISRDAARWAP